MWNRLNNTSKKGTQKAMPTAEFGIPNETCPPFDISPVGTLFKRSDVVDANLIRSDERLIRELASMLDTQLLAALESRTASEFAQAREKIWPKYVRSIRALSDTVSNLMSEDQIAIITEAANAQFKEDLEKQRGLRFGEALIDQMMFTLWAMNKIRSMGQKIHDAGEPSDKDADLRLNRDYQVYLLWTQFHMDVIAAAMEFRKSVPEDVQRTIRDGLRASVNVYAIMKDALRLRRPELQASLETPMPWDEEDDELLASSMRDVNAFSDSDDH
jgi:hypothetical protein